MYLLKVQVSDVAQLDDVWPQAVNLPVRLSVVLHLRSQVILQVDFALVYLPKTALQLLIIDQKAKGSKGHRSKYSSRKGFNVQPS